MPHPASLRAPATGSKAMLPTPHPARNAQQGLSAGRGPTRAGHGVLAMHTSICTAIGLRRAVLASGLVAPVPLAQPLRHRPSSVQRALGRAFTRANGVGPLARAEGGTTSGRQRERQRSGDQGRPGAAWKRCRGTEKSAEDLVGPPERMETSEGKPPDVEIA